MSNGYLRTTALGNLGQDPELRFTQGGTAVLNVRIACNLRVKKNGEWTDEPTWIGVTCFGKRAEALHKILGKGQQVFAAGRLEIRTYEKRDGGTGTSVSIIADEVVLCGGKANRTRERAPAEESGDMYSPPDASGADFADDDIPFSARDGRLP